MNQFLKKNEKTISIVLISFAIGFAVAFSIFSVYSHTDIVGNICTKTAEQAQAYFKKF